MRRRKQATKGLRRKMTKIARRDAQTAVRGPSIAELQEQLDIRTRERDEALEQQAATAEVLKVISSSTGKLEPVFQTILENSITICEAKFGMFWLTEGHSFRCVALHGTSPAFTELRRREPIFHPNPTLLSPLGRIARSKQLVHVADCRAEQAYIEGDPGFVALVDLAGARTILVVPILRDNELVGALNIFRQEVRPFTDKQIGLLTSFASQAVIAIENARLLSELRESLQQQTATADVLKVISSSPGELEPVFEAMLANAMRVCEAKFGFMYRCSGDTWEIQAEYGAIPAYADIVRRSTRPGPQTVVGRIASTRQMVQVADLAASRGYAERDPLVVAAVEIGGVRSILGVPLFKEDALIGAILLYRDEVRPFTDKQIELVENFAAQAVIAIENTRLLNELRQRTDDLSEALEQQTATSEVLKVVSRSPGNLEPVFDAMLQNAVRICGAKFGNLMLREGDAFRLGASHGAPQAYVDYLHSNQVFRTNPGLAQLVKTKEHYHLTDISAAPTFGDELREATVNLAGARTLIGVPMLKDDKVIGAIIIYRQEVRPFTNKQIELVKNFAAQAVIAIENTRLLNELRESLQQQTATADVLKVISSSAGELQPVFKTMLAKAVERCEASFGAMWLVDGEGYRTAAMHGDLSQAYVEQWRSGTLHLPKTDIPMVRAIRSRKTVHTPDMRKEKAYLEGDPLAVSAADIGGIRTLVTVPMLKEGEAVGVITIYRREVLPFNQKQIELVENFAAQAVIAIENTRLLNELRKSLQQQTATSEVLKVISSSPGELEPVFSAMLENATRICEAKFGNLFLYEGGVFRTAALYGAPPAWVEARRRVMVARDLHPDTPLARVTRTKKIAHIADAKTTQGYIERDPNFASMVEIAGARTILSVPMLKEDELIGVITIYRQEVRPFTNKQIELVRILPLRPSSPSRTRGCSASCVNCCSSRPPRPTFSRSSAALHSTYRPYLIRW